MSHPSFKIAIQPDRYGANDASSPRWTRLLQEAGHEVKEVNVYRADILEQLYDCTGFMWRHGHYPNMRQIARRLLPVLEDALGLVVYPDLPTCWHYDDKIAQALLFTARGIPAPKTWVWFDAAGAREWLSRAAFPLVLKLWGGAGSTNVRLVNSPNEAEAWLAKLFGEGLYSLGLKEPGRFSSAAERIKQALRLLLKGRPADLPQHQWELHRNYILFQEFLPGNEFDTRVTVIGNRAFAFRRFNRAADFRASGSGKLDPNPEQIAPEFIRLAFQTAQALGMQSCAIDGLWRGGEAVVGEVSYTYLSAAVHACPGYWDSELNWHAGRKWPEEAQVEDFLVRLNARKNLARAPRLAASAQMTGLCG